MIARRIIDERHVQFAGPIRRGMYATSLYIVYTAMRIPRLRKAIKPHTLKVPNNSGNRKEALRGSEIAELFGHGNDGKLGSAADCSLQDAGSEKLTSRRQFCLGRSSDGAFGRSVDRFAT